MKQQRDDSDNSSASLRQNIVKKRSLTDLNYFLSAFGRFIIPTVCTLIVLGLSLYPYSQSGYYSDDIYNSELNGTLSALHENLYEFLCKILNMWVVQDGRLYPVGLVTNYFFWTYADNIKIDRVLQVALVLFDVALFWLLLRKASKSFLMATMAVFFIPILLQVSSLSDGVTSFGGLYQVILLFVLIALYSLLRYVSEDGASSFLWLGLAAISEICALLSYEISVCLLPGMVVICLWLSKDKTRKIVGLGMTFGLFFLYLIAYSWFSIHKTAGYDGSEFWLSGLTLRTFWAQFISAFPLALVDFGASPTVKVNKFFISSVLFLLGFLCAFIFMKNTNIESSHGKNKKGILALFVVGLSLALFPPLIISVSRKYEHLVGLGNAYSVVFVQIFGVALLLSLFFLEVSNLSILQKKYFSFFFVKNKMLPFYFLSFLYATVFAATVPANLERILSYNKTWEVVERKQMEQILSAGFLDTVPSENSIVVVRHPYLWESGLLPPFDKKRREVCTAFFTLYAKRPLHCVTTDSLKNKEIVFPQVPADHIFIFEREVVDGNIERAILYNDATRSIAVRRHHKGRDFYVFSYEKGRFAIPPLFVK